MTEKLTAALTDYFQRAIQQNGEHGQGIIEYDPDWQSPCQLTKYDDSRIFWQPQVRSREADLNNIEQALGLELNPDIKTFYCQFFAPTLESSWQGDKLSLIQVWNEQDFEILQENLLGHLMMKQKLKQSLTVFVAATDDDEYLISVVNATGEVVLERVGCEPKQKLADNLAEFINQLSFEIN
ncbi:SecY-interacting protein [Catenovulum sp. 2E275]|uniref:SecY-interacting protein n=1 Tax=Catenovulum sp. 2E275 TaxID=2980497 RepID=UPI0021D3530E|nr:SecY-interacting protein [Catenovulum sp. 2E275]MCU4676080.1 SecY-interacting protein [Catenovulum sp. 2E275]